MSTLRYDKRFRVFREHRGFMLETVVNMGAMIHFWKPYWVTYLVTLTYSAGMFSGVPYTPSS